MSRCFPFPPPGYEKKPRPDDVNLLTKENEKEKKHKKEKKDKDKKERKEKRDKKSEEKHKEKKEKKHKHKDKKDKERDKNKKRTSNEKKVLGTSEHQNGGKSIPIGIQGNDSQAKLLLELEKRFGNDDGATECKMFEKIVATHQGSIRLQEKVTKTKSDVFSEAKEKFTNKRDNHNMVNFQTLKVLARGLEMGVVSNFIREDQKKIEGDLLQLERVDEKQKERKEKKRHREIDCKGDKHQDRDQNNQNKPNDRKGEKGKEKEKAVEERSKEPITEGNISTVGIQGNGSSHLFNENSKSKGNLGKRKDPAANGILLDNVGWPNKLPRPVSSKPLIQMGSKYDASQSALERQVTVQDHNGNVAVSHPQSLTAHGRKVDSGHVVNGFISHQTSSVKNHKVQNSLLVSPPVKESVKRKESCQEVVDLKILKREGGSIHKVNGIVSPSPVVENQRALCNPLTIQTTAERQGLVGLTKVDNMKESVNGLLKTRDDKKDEEKTSKRPPHPDSKYLSQILTVPEVEWSDLDDQDWLFSSSDSAGKKPPMVSIQIEDTMHVWAKALWVEPAGIHALPYVIPY